MSQAGIINVAGGGGGGAPIQTLTGDTGGAVPPTANNIFVIGGDSIVNNDNGILVAGNAGTSTEVFTLTNRIVVTGTTTNLQTTSVTLFTPTNLTAYSYKGTIVGFDTIGGFGAGGSIEGLMRKNAGVVTVVGSSDTLDENDANLEPPINATSVDWNIVANGGDLDVQFVGVAGATINWKCLFTYIQVS